MSENQCTKCLQQFPSHPNTATLNDNTRYDTNTAAGKTENPVKPNPVKLTKLLEIEIFRKLPINGSTGDGSTSVKLVESLENLSTPQPDNIATNVNKETGICITCGESLNKLPAVQNKGEKSSSRIHTGDKSSSRIHTGGKSSSRIHTGEKSSSRDVCKKSLHENATETKRSRARKEKKYPCSQCGKINTTQVYFDRHIKVHEHEKALTCNICGKTFANKLQLSRHKHTHTDEKPFPCDDCEKFFKTSSHRTNHVRSVHQGVKNHVCDKCQKRFYHKAELIRHQPTHTGEKPFVCTVCGKAFSYKSSLTKHYRIHKGEKPLNLKCPTCRRSFLQHSSLANHKCNYFSCSVCGKQFPYHSSVIQHKLRRHKQINSV